MRNMKYRVNSNLINLLLILILISILIAISLFEIFLRVAKYAIKSKKFFYGFKNTILSDRHMNEDGHYISSGLLSNAIYKIYNLK